MSNVRILNELEFGNYGRTFLVSLDNTTPPVKVRRYKCGTWCYATDSLDDLIPEDKARQLELETYCRE